MYEKVTIYSRSYY